VEVWTGEREGVFKTSDLDFIGPDFLTAYKIQEAGIEGSQAVNSRHILVESVPVEFPVGPLGVGDALLDPWMRPSWSQHSSEMKSAVSDLKPVFWTD